MFAAAASRRLLLTTPNLTARAPKLFLATPALGQSFTTTLAALAAPRAFIQNCRPTSNSSALVGSVARFSTSLPKSNSGINNGLHAKGTELSRFRVPGIIGAAIGLGGVGLVGYAAYHKESIQRDAKKSLASSWSPPCTTIEEDLVCGTLRYKDEKEFTWYDIIHAYYVVWKVAKRTYQFDKAALLEREEITFTELKKIVKGDGDECVKIVGYTGTGLVEVQVLRKDCTLRLYRMQAEVFRHCGSRNYQDILEFAKNLDYAERPCPIHSKKTECQCFFLFCDGSHNIWRSLYVQGPSHTKK